MIRVQQDDFNIGAEIAKLKAGRTDIGAIVAFVGIVRDQSGAVEEMTLEHYPGMTEAELQRIESEACARWPLQASLIVHRTGTLYPSDNIVLVLTASAHRADAFAASRYAIERIKQIVPIWKHEYFDGGDTWIEGATADPDDQEARARARKLACA